MSTLSAPALPGAEILVAVLNAVFDIYGDEERAYDSVFVSQGYLNVLASIVAKVRAEVRSVIDLQVTKTLTNRHARWTDARCPSSEHEPKKRMRTWRRLSSTGGT
jgi:hypothetical protein